MGPNFQAAHMATTQNTKDTASRTNPRSNPMMVEPNRTKTIKTSAPVKSVFRFRRFAPCSTGSKRPRPIDIVKDHCILPEGCGRRRETSVTNPKSGCRGHQARDLSRGLQLRDSLGSATAIRHGADAYSVPQRRPRTARHDVNRKALRLLLRLQLAHQFIGVGAAGKAAQLHGPGLSRHRRLRRG